jgi:hypothetical protein
MPRSPILEAVSNDNVIAHSHRELTREAKRERAIADCAEARSLQKTVIRGVKAYSEFLERHGLIWDYKIDADLPRLKAQALIITLDYRSGNDVIDIRLKDGALDRTARHTTQAQGRLADAVNTSSAQLGR